LTDPIPIEREKRLGWVYAILSGISINTQVYTQSIYNAEIGIVRHIEDEYLSFYCVIPCKTLLMITVDFMINFYL